MPEQENKSGDLSIEELRAEIVSIRLQKAIIADFNRRRERENWNAPWEKEELDLKKPSLV